MEWVVSAIIAVVSAIGGGVAAGLPLYMRLRKLMSEIRIAEQKALGDIRSAERKDIVSHQSDLIKVLQSTVESLTNRVDQVQADQKEAAAHSLKRELECQRQLHETKTLLARMSERMSHYEDILRDKGHHFRPWDESSKEHTPLPEPKGGE